MTTMAQRVAQLEESETAHSASDHEMTQSVDNTEGEQSSVEKGQRPPKTSAHAVSGANVEKLHLQSTPLPLNWADRNLEESVDYTANITWPEEDEDESRGVKLFKISKRSDEFLGSCFTHSVPNATRRNIRDKFGAPNTPKTACPTLDKVIKTRLSANTKARDKTLAKQQALLLDAVGPLASILEDASTGELTMKGTVDAVQTALKLLGNASMNLNRERRKNVIRDLNTNLEEMAEDDSLFVDAAPQLLGDGFTKKAKERDDELKCLSQASKKTNTKHSSFFRGGRPYNTNTGSYPSRRGGQNYRGNRGNGKGWYNNRYTPYNKGSPSGTAGWKDQQKK